MSVQKTKLEWSLFPEDVWANLEVLGNACADGWLNEQNPYEKLDAYRFIKNTLPWVNQAAEVNEDVMDLLRGLSGKETFVMLEKILHLKTSTRFSHVETHVQAVLQEMVADYILNKSLGV